LNLFDQKRNVNLNRFHGSFEVLEGSEGEKTKHPADGMGPVTASAEGRSHLTNTGKSKNMEKLKDVVCFWS
jgi:hypothetical protein